MYFSASGAFNFAQEDIFKKSIKASFKLTKLTTTGEPNMKTSLHLYDHLLKSIVLYGLEIWDTFKTNSAACKKSNCFIFGETYIWFINRPILNMELLFTWLSLVMSMMVSFCAVLFPTRCLG